MYESRPGIELYYFYDSYGNLTSIRYIKSGETTAYSYYVTTNAQGDVFGIYESNGDQVAAYEYDAWGNCISVQALNEDTDVFEEITYSSSTASHIAFLNPFRYRGYYYDRDMGLYYLQSRYYDPQVGRFVNSDNVSDSEAGILGYNTFVYCGNNPINSSDPSGHGIIKNAIKWIAKNVVKPVVKKIQKSRSKVNGTYSRGLNVSLATGIFSLNAQGGISIDAKGNTAIQGSFSGGVSTGTPGASITLYQSRTNAPNIDNLNGMGYQLGGSAIIPIEGFPVAIGGDFNIIPDSKQNNMYYGVTTNIGVAFGEAGGEFHTEFGSTGTWDRSSFNVFEVAQYVYIRIMEW